MWSVLCFFIFLLSLIQATPVTQGTRANVTLYLESLDDRLNNQVLYTSNQGDSIHFYYVGDKSILFATSFIYDGSKYRLHEQQKGSNDKYYLTILNSMLRGQKDSGLKVTLNTDGSLHFAGSDHLYAYKMSDGAIKFLILLFVDDIPNNVSPVKVKAKINWATL